MPHETPNKLENHVTSLELSKRLEELGVKQESIFYYNSETGSLQQGFTSHTDEKGMMQWSISAFLSSELGEMLKEEAVTFYGDPNIGENRWMCGGDVGFHSETEPDARAKMLIYLIENKLLTPPL